MEKPASRDRNHSWGDHSKMSNQGSFGPAQGSEFITWTPSDIIGTGGTAIGMPQASPDAVPSPAVAAPAASAAPAAPVMPSAAPAPVVTSAPDPATGSSAAASAAPPAQPVAPLAPVAVPEPPPSAPSPGAATLEQACPVCKTANPAEGKFCVACGHYFLGPALQGAAQTAHGLPIAPVAAPAAPIAPVAAPAAPPAPPAPAVPLALPAPVVIAPAMSVPLKRDHYEAWLRSQGLTDLSGFEAVLTSVFSKEVDSDRRFNRLHTQATAFATSKGVTLPKITLAAIVALPPIAAVPAAPIAPIAAPAAPPAPVVPPPTIAAAPAPAATAAPPPAPVPVAPPVPPAPAASASSPGPPAAPLPPSASSAPMSSGAAPSVSSAPPATPAAPPQDPPDSPTDTTHRWSTAVKVLGIPFLMLWWIILGSWWLIRHAATGCWWLICHAASIAWWCICYVGIGLWWCIKQVGNGIAWLFRRPRRWIPAMATIVAAGLVLLVVIWKPWKHLGSGGTASNDQPSPAPTSKPVPTSKPRPRALPQTARMTCNHDIFMSGCHWVEAPCKDAITLTPPRKRTGPIVVACGSTKYLSERDIDHYRQGNIEIVMRLDAPL